MNRKQFLKHASLATIGVITQPATTLLSNSLDEKHRDIFDLHCHPGVFFMKEEAGYPGDKAFSERIQDMQQAGVVGAFVSLVADWPLLQVTDKGVVPSGQFGGNEGWNEYKTQLHFIKILLAQSNLQPIQAKPSKMPGDTLNTYISCEGGDFLGGSVERIDEAYEDGVRSIQLVHYAPNELGDLQTWKEQFGGLSPFGKKVVRKMNEIGMIIDVAHASARTVKDVADSTQQPIILSHSILKSSVQGPMSARAINEGHARLVANTGGIIGMWPSGISRDLDEFTLATLRMIDVVGVDHVGIGTDMDANFKPVINNYAQVLEWKKGLKANGLSDEEVSKVSGGNMARVLNQVL